jgi:hypothetical protein
MAFNSLDTLAEGFVGKGLEEGCIAFAVMVAHTKQVKGQEPHIMVLEPEPQPLVGVH